MTLTTTKTAIGMARKTYSSMRTVMMMKIITGTVT